MRRYHLLLFSEAVKAKRIKAAPGEDLIAFVQRNADAVHAIRMKHETPTKNAKYYMNKTADYGKRTFTWFHSKATRAKEISQSDWKALAKEKFRRRTPEEKAAVAAQKEAARVESTKQMAKYYVAKDVQGTLVCKQVYFEDDCKMTEFADRMRDAEILFRRLPPFGDLCLKVIPDKSSPSAIPTEKDGKESSKASEDQQCTTSKLPESNQSSEAKKSIEFSEDDFTVTVKDSCTPKELYDFLEREALRVQMRQRAWAAEEDRVRKTVAETIDGLKLASVKFKIQVGGETTGDVSSVCEQLLRYKLFYKKHLEGLFIRIKADQDNIEFDLQDEYALVIPSRMYRPLVITVPFQYKILEVFHQVISFIRYILFLIALTLLGDSEFL